MRRWAHPVRIAWTIVMVTAAGLSSVVWGNSPPLTGILLVFGALIVVLSIQWALRISLAN
ncbi:MAG TPA: hypothetical protein VKA08_12900 [Balneolales bacterium]|nr:hypothetical protein [Balneolales bacterium]